MKEKTGGGQVKHLGLTKVTAMGKKILVQNETRRVVLEFQGKGPCNL
jgi:hypothetical protein